MKRIAFVLIAVAVVTGCGDGSRTDVSYTVVTDTTHDCAKGPNASIDTSDAAVELTSTCERILVKGGNNKVTIEAAKRIRRRWREERNRRRRGRYDQSQRRRQYDQIQKQGGDKKDSGSRGNWRRQQPFTVGLILEDNTLGFGALVRISSRPASRTRAGRGKDAHYWAPPAQTRTCSFPAYGSHLGSRRQLLAVSVACVAGCCIVQQTRDPNWEQVLAEAKAKFGSSASLEEIAKRAHALLLKSVGAHLGKYCQVQHP